MSRLPHLLSSASPAVSSLRHSPKANFAANFKNNASLFEGFESYAKANPLRLSEDGRKELAELIKELAR